MSRTLVLQNTRTGLPGVFAAVAIVLVVASGCGAGSDTENQPVRVQVFVGAYSSIPVRTREDEWGIGPLEQVRQIQASVTSPDQSAFIRRYAGNDYLAAPAGVDFMDFIASESMNTPATTAALLLADGNLSDYTEVARQADKQADKQVPILHVVSEKAEAPAADWLTRNMPNSKMLALGAPMMFWEFPDEFNR